MRKQIILLTASVLLFSSVNAIYAQQNGGQTEGKSVSQQIVTPDRSLKKEAEEFTNSCDIPDSLYNYAIRLYNQALELKEKAEDANSDSVYQAYFKQYYEVLEASVIPFEKAFNLLYRDKSTRLEVSEYLRNVCYELYRSGAVSNASFYKERFEKYSEYYTMNS